jgi:hypothetical protein
VREGEKQRGAKTELYKVFKDYAIYADGTTLPEGESKPDGHMFREAIKQIKAAMG